MIDDQAYVYVLSFTQNYLYNNILKFGILYVEHLVCFV
jgi:hypothetical protein